MKATGGKREIKNMIENNRLEWHDVIIDLSVPMNYMFIADENDNLVIINKNNFNTLIVECKWFPKQEKRYCIKDSEGNKIAEIKDIQSFIRQLF